MRSRYRRAILESMLESPQTPARISMITGIRTTHVSRSLGELSSRKLVEQLTTTYRGKLFSITSEGEEVLKALKEYEL